MINYKQEMVSLLSGAGVPVFYELFIKPEIIPSISYIEYDNIDALVGDTLEYSTIGYQIKIHAYKVEEIATISPAVDIILKNAGFRRTFYTELNDGNRIVAVIRYVATGYKR